MGEEGFALALGAQRVEPVPGRSEVNRPRHLPAPLHVSVPEVPSKEETVTVPPGFRASKRADEFWEKVAVGIWEPVTVRILTALLNTGGTHIDVGAWIGPTTLIAGSHADHVLAFEPDPVAFGELERNVAMNPDIAVKVELRQAAVYNANGVMQAAAQTLGDSGTRLVHRDMKRHQDTASVATLDARTLAHDDAAFNTCTTIKIDIEGAEYTTVPRLAKWLRSRRPVLLLGIHGSPMFERFTWAPAKLAQQLRRITTLALRLRLFGMLWTHRYWYLPDDAWSMSHDSWAHRPSTLHEVTGRERWRVLTRVRDLDLVLSPHPLPDLER